MDEFTETIRNYASQENGTPAEPAIEEPAAMAQPSAEPATENAPAAMAEPSTEPSTPEAIIPEATPAEAQAPAIDYNAILGEISEGAFKSVDDFKSAIPKITEYDALKAKAEELEAKSKVSPFANEFAEKLNELLKNGAAPDQVKNFIQISQVDFEKLSPIDAKVANMVKDGYSEAIARKIVEQEYPLDDYEEGTDERLILEEKLRISSKADYEALKGYKADMSKVDVDTSAQEQAEEARLTAIAQAEQHKQTVSQTVPKIAETFLSVGEIPIVLKEGEEPVKMKFDFTPEYKAGIPQMLENFFVDGNTPINNETVADAYGYIRADYLHRNIDTIVQDSYKSGYSAAVEATVNKYENRSGLPVPAENLNVDNSQQQLSEFMNKVANGK